MIQHPAILALTLASLLTGGMVAVAALFGLRILRRWNPQSGSELQVQLERRTYLISTLVGYALVFEILSLFLFIFTADRLHTLFVGAMCAAGTLNVNPFGYPTLLLNVGNSLAAGVWLLLNHADNRGYDYPLIRSKYALLALLALPVCAEVGVQWAYFANLHADVITSCCGSLFGAGSGNLGSELAAFPLDPLRSFLAVAIVATCGCGLLVRRRGRCAPAFALLSTITLLLTVASLISFLCLYFYELPTHHCPFCLLQAEYHGVGYLLYATLLVAGISGLGVGLLHPFRSRPSLASIIPQLQRRLVALTLLAYGLFFLLVIGRILTTPFRLG